MLDNIILQADVVYIMFRCLLQVQECLSTCSDWN